MGIAAEGGREVQLCQLIAGLSTVSWSGSLFIEGILRRMIALSTHHASLRFLAGATFLLAAGFSMASWPIIENSASNQDDSAVDIATDKAGNVTITSQALVNGAYDTFTSRYDRYGNLQWRQSYGWAGYLEYPVAVTLDNKGNSFVLCSEELAAGFELTLLRYDQAGTLKWAKHLQSSSGAYDYARDVAMLPNGNVAVVGSFTAGSNARDVVTAVYQPSGAKLWQQVYTTSGVHNYDAKDVKVDSNGNIVIVGTSANQNSDVNYLTLRYSPTGALTWARQQDAGNHRDDLVGECVIDSNDNIIITGIEYLNIGGDAITIKYDSSGKRQWLKRFHTSSLFNAGREVAVDSQDNVVVAVQSSTNGYTGWTTLLKYSPSGILQWKQKYIGDGGSSGDAHPYGLEVDRLDNIYLGGGEKDPAETSYDHYYYFMARYNSFGSRQWVKIDSISSEGQNLPSKVVYDHKSDAVYMTGTSYNPSTGSQDSFTPKILLS